MFEIKEDKKPAKDKKITVRFNAEEYQAINNFIDNNERGIKSFTELTRQAIKEFLEK